MNILKRLLATVALGLVVGGLQAQQLPIDNQYMLNTFSLNPAFAGENGNIEAFLGYRSSWMGVEGAPRLSQINLNAAMPMNMGLGLSVRSESVGNFEHFYGNIAYAYHLQLGDDMVASLGLEAMYYRNQINTSKVVSQGLDPLLINAAALHGSSFDAGAGLGFWAKGFTFGASAQRLMGAQINYGGEEKNFFYKTNMQANAFISYQIGVGQVGDEASSRTASQRPKFRFEPMAVIQYTGGKVFYNGALNILFRDRVWAGGQYRTDGSIGIHLGGALQERIIMNYNYEFGMGQRIAAQSSGTHEISIGFLLKAPKDRRGRSLFLLDSPLTPAGPIGPDPKLEQKLNAVNDSLKKYIAKTEPRIAKLEEDLKYFKDKNEEIKDNVDASKYEAPFVMRNINFGYNSDKLLPTYFAELDKLVRTLQTNAKWEIKISGHTDNQGSPSYNKALSLKRANSVRTYFMGKGIAESRIVVEGLGDTKPLNPADTPDARAQNRRIEGAFKKNAAPK